MPIKFFLIKKENQDERIDVFLKNQFPKSSRGWLQKLIKQGLVSINGRKIKSRYRLKEKDKLRINFKEKKEVKISPNPDIKLEIVFENEDFLVLNKAVGILVHPAKKPTDKTIANGLLAYLPQIKNVGENSLRPGIVHRLDKDTSGLLLVAKNQITFFELKDLFKERKIKKIYQALVFGQIKKNAGKLESYIARSHKSPQKRISISKLKENMKGKKALTYYNVEKKLKDKKNNQYCLLKLKLKTGRTHQLRSQLFSINHPIVGDPLYKIKEQDCKNIERMFLYAKELAFIHKNHYYQFILPLPKNLKKFLSKLK
jgi:23S rRNA pseudouridine1911/1915/1917 synthase